MVTTAVDVDRARTAAEAVPDPELPPVTLGMLGVVHDVSEDDGVVTVELLPTFSGCPAQDVMGEDVRDAVMAVGGVRDVVVQFRYDPPWTADRISPEGHEALKSFGIAPPDGRKSLPVIGTAPSRPCPYCGSTDTDRDGLFGPTPCRDVRFCNACSQPFEAFKNL